MSSIEEMKWDWDSAIEDNGEEKQWSTLPPGVYDFTVAEAMRARHEARPGGKIPSCPKMDLGLTLQGKNGEVAQVHESLFLCQQMKFKLVRFFIAIGDMKPGETLKPDWDGLIGKKGRAKVGVRKYTKKDGSEGEINNVEEFLPPMKEDDIPF